MGCQPLRQVAADVGFWLQADLPAFLIDFRFALNSGHWAGDVCFRTVYVRFAPSTGHSRSRTRLPLLTRRRLARYGQLPSRWRFRTPGHGQQRVAAIPVNVFKQA